MKKPIYYTSKDSGDSFKLVFTTEEPEFINLFLDQLNICVENYISEEHFDSLYEEYMTIDIMDPDEVVKIGELTFKKMDLQDEMIIS